MERPQKTRHPKKAKKIRRPSINDLDKARRREVYKALTAAGDASGPMIVRMGKLVAADGQPQKATELAKSQRPTNTALALALEDAGLAPRPKPEPRKEQMAGREDDATRDRKQATEKPRRPSNVQQAKGGKAPEAPMVSKPKRENSKAQKPRGSARNKVKRPPNQKASSQAKAKRRADAASEAAAAPARRAEEKLNSLERLIENIGDASFTDLASNWNKYVKSLGYIQSTGHNLDRALLYQRLLEAIEREWLRRSKLDHYGDDYFDWPTTASKRGSGDLPRVEWVTEGALAYLGYHVGEKASIGKDARWSILRRIFAGHLPPIESPDYMASWGKPGTPVRLKKMADSIASFVRSAKRRTSTNLAVAVAEWEADLCMLHDDYYVGRFGFGMRKTGFSWPLA